MGYINKIQIDSNSAHLIEPTLFAITSGTASAYIAEISNFELTSGVNIYLQVHNNNEQNATLNINNLGEKDIFYKNSNIVANQLKKDYLYSLVYDGVKWQLVGDTSGIWEGNAETSTKAKALANLYNSRPTDANIAHVANGGVVHFKATSSMTSNKPGDGNILHFHWDTSDAWDGQLFVPDGVDHMRYRAHTNASTWYDWRTLLDSTNYSSYAVSAITSIDEVVPRFNGTTGQIQTSRMSISDTGTISFSYNGRYPGDTYLLNASGNHVAEYWYDTGHATNVTSGVFKWREYSPNTTADTTTTGYHETYSLPIVTAGLTANKAYNILTTKDLSFSITGNAATVSRATFGDKDNGEHNANNIVSNGLYYYSSNGPATTLLAKSTDGAIYCQAYNTNWVAQIAQDYRNGGLFIRGKNNGTWTDWYGIPRMTVETYPALLPIDGSNNWIKIGVANNNYGLLPSQTGTAGSGHNYLGTSSWYWKYSYIDEMYARNLTISGANDGIYFAGTKATYQMIRFIDNTSDAYGNGIAIGGGGQTIIGGGKSASILTGQTLTNGGELMWIGNDGDIELFPEQQNGFNDAYKITINSNGIFIGIEGNTTKVSNLKVSSGAGSIGLYSNTSTTGDRGLWAYSHGTNTSGKNIITLDTNNNIHYNTGTAGYLYMTGGSGIVHTSGAPMLYFLRGNDQTVPNRMGAIFCNYGNTNSITRCDRIYLRHYSYNSSTGAAINNWDQYRLPAATPDLTTSYSYDILTTKDMSFSITGNAATATRINGNLAEISSATYCNIWVSSNASASGIPNYVSGVYVAANTGIITAKGFSGPLTGNVAGNCSGSSGSCTGNALTCTYPLGFSARADNATWGSQTGSTVTQWSIGSCVVDFRKDNPSSGKLSIKVDGRFYGNEGTYPTMLMNYADGYWGMGDPDAVSSGWLRVPASGLLTNTKTGSTVGSGSGYIGAIEWRFKAAYIDTLNGNCSGNAATATKATGDSDGNTINTTYAKLSGAAFTGNITITKAGEAYVCSKNSSTGNTVYLDSGSGADHGIYSGGYYNGSSHVASGKWLIYRNNAGNVIVNGDCTGNAATATMANTVKGSYTAGGGKQNPNYFGVNKVGFLMMNTTVNNNTQYKDWIIMDCYSGTDVGGGVAFGVNRQSLGAYIMRSAAARTSWAESAELLGTHNYADYAVAKTGSVMSGTLAIINNLQNDATYNSLLYIEHKAGSDWGIVIEKNKAYDYGMAIRCKSNGTHGLDVTGRITGTTVYGAVWNDYAECRKVAAEIGPGRVVYETNSKVMRLTNMRLQPSCRIVSDTYGMCIGETEEAKTPIAVTGRVLVYPYRSRSEYQLGAAVCSAPNGTVDIMTREEIMTYPERIIGTVSEIPDYEIWHAGERDGNHEIKVNGRIWIYVR